MYFLVLFLLNLFHTDRPIVVARDTTYIMSPLRPDGLPDYEKYLFDLNRAGATPDNNAAVLIWQSLWPNYLEPGDIEAMRAELGLKEIPSAKALLQPLYGKSNVQRILDWRQKQYPGADEVDYHDLIAPAIDHAWTSRQFPPLANWVEANKQPLDVLVAASQRPRFYSPSPTLLNGRRDFLVGISEPGLENVRDAARALSVRAMRNVGEHSFNEAWADLLAIHRLARLAAQGHTVIDQLFAAAISDMACRGTLQLLGSDNLPVALTRQIKQDLAKLPKVTDVSKTIEPMERVIALDAVIQAKLFGLRSLSAIEPDREFDPTNWLSLDCNIAMRRVNYWYDRIASAMRLPTREARNLELSACQADVAAAAKQGLYPFRLVTVFFSLKARSELTGTIVACLLLSVIEAPLAAEDRVQTTVQLTRVGAALEIYRAEHRRYPTKLDDLVPAFMNELPVDAYHSEPFIYQRTDDGYLLYSVGNNGGDDGGDSEVLEMRAGRLLKEREDGASHTEETEIRDGADDVSIRLPRIPFKLPGITMPKFGKQ